MGAGKPTMAQTGATNTTVNMSSTPKIPTWLDQTLQNRIKYGDQSIKDYGNMSIAPQNVAPMSPWERTASNTLANYGESDAYQTGMRTMGNTARGDYLYGGPAQQAFVDANMRMAMPGIFSAWGSAGRAGGQLGQLQLGRVATDAYAGMYGDERARQEAASQNLLQAGQIPANLQMGVGGLERGITDATNAAQYQAEQAQLAQRLQAANLGIQQGNMLPSLAGMYGTDTRSKTMGTTFGTEQGANPIGGALGGALSGAMIGGMMGGPAAPFTAATGAMVGAAGGAGLGLLGTR